MMLSLGEIMTKRDEATLEQIFLNNIMLKKDHQKLFDNLMKWAADIEMRALMEGETNEQFRPFDPNGGLM
jgi:hypothetical protein